MVTARSLPFLLLLFLLAAPSTATATATVAADDDAAAPNKNNNNNNNNNNNSGSGDGGRYPLIARLAPCLPLPVHTNCSEVPATLQQNLMTCTHVSFQPGGYGQGARRAELAFEVEAEESEEGEGLTMVLLVGSTLWFEDQAQMWDVLQPKIAAALQASHGYDPTLQGPCMGGRQEEAGEDGAAVAVARSRRRRRQRLLRGLGEEEKEKKIAAAAAAVREDGADGVVPVPDHAAGGGLPSCADMVAAFNANAADGGVPGGAATPFAL
jgi:hypothetical protein